MGDDLFTEEEELLAQAIALSLEQAESNAQASLIQQRAEIAASRPPPVSSTPESSRGASGGDGGARPNPPTRSNTTQSYDSVLTDPEESLTNSLRVSTIMDMDSSLRSSPDLGIAAESDMDPPLQSGMLGVKSNEFQKNSRESLMSSPESERVHPRGLQNLALDGGVVGSHGNPDEEGRQLPFTRLSSLHDMNLDLAAAKGKVGKGWSPNQESLELITGMGISENAAKRALYHTGNDNAELAVGWVFENINDPELHEPFAPPTPTLVAEGKGNMPGLSAIYHSFEDETLSYKMILVANLSLRMGVGKLCAQVGHAVLALYHCTESDSTQKAGLREWEGRGAKKVVLKGNDAQHLLDLKQKALELQIPNILVHDAGRTQIDPGSLTVLGLFGMSKDVDSVTGNLKLLWCKLMHKTLGDIAIIASKNDFYWLFLSQTTVISTFNKNSWVLWLLC